MQEIPERIIRDAEDKMNKAFGKELDELSDLSGGRGYRQTIRLVALAYIEGRLEGEAFMLIHFKHKQGKS